VMLIVNCCLLALAICDQLEYHHSNLRETLGNIVIYANLVLCLTSNVYLVAYLLTGFKSAYEKSKKHKSQSILAWMTVFLSPFESGGMDVDVFPDQEQPVKYEMGVDRLNSPQSLNNLSDRSLFIKQTVKRRFDLLTRQSVKTATTLSESQSNLQNSTNEVDPSFKRRRTRHLSSIFLLHSPPMKPHEEAFDSEK